MNSFLKFALFLLFFQIEVRVKANSIGIESLKNVIQTNENTKSVKKDGQDLKLAPNTLVWLKEDQKTFRFCEGQMRVHVDGQSNLQFLHGTITAENGAFLISTKGANRERIWIANEGSQLLIHLRGGQVLELPAGFQVWIDGLNQEAKQTYGVIEPWDLKEYLFTLNQLNLGEKAYFVELATQLREISKMAQAQSPGIYQKIIDRQIAALESEEKARLDRIENEKRILAARKKLFFERTFGR